MSAEKEKRQVVLVGLITALCLTGDSMLYVALPTHRKEAGLSSLWEVGVLLAANRFIRVPLNPVISRVYRRISHRNGMLVAVILAVVATASYGRTGFGLLLAMRIIWGIAWTFLRLGAYFFIVNISSDQNRGYYMGIYNGIFRLGSFVGMLVGGIIADFYGMKVASIMFSGMTLLAFFLVFSVYPSSEVRTPVNSAVSKFRLNWRYSKMIWALVTGFFIALLYQGAFTATLSHLISTRQKEIFVLGMLYGPASLAGILQALRWGWEPWLAPWFGKKSDQWGRRPVLIVSLVIASLLFGTINLYIPFWLWIFVLIGIQFTATSLTTVVDSVGADVAAQSSQKASIMTLYSIVTDLGSALGALTSYIIADFFKLHQLFWGSSLVLMLLALRWYFLSSPQDDNIKIS